MGRREDTLAEQNQDMKDLLEDLLTQIQELREEFTSALDDLEDMLMGG